MTRHRDSSIARWLPLFFLCLSLSPATGALGSAPEVTMSDKPVADHRVIFDFTAPDAAPWRSVDDVVMGGVSSSRMTVEEGRAVFQGEVSLENNGGFASVRSRPGEHNLNGFDGLAVRVRGDGQRYSFRVRMAGQMADVSYQVKFQTNENEWQTVRFPFSAFEAVFRGRELPRAPALDPGKIRTFGFLISDKQEGPFRLEVEEIRAYQE